MRSCCGEWKCGGVEQDCGTKRVAGTENERVEAFWKDKLETDKYFLIHKGKKSRVPGSIPVTDRTV